MQELISATKEKDIKKIKALIASGIDLNTQDQEGKTALMHACEGELKEIIETLLRDNPDINARSYNGSTALHCSAWRGNAEIMKLLLTSYSDADIDIDAKDDAGWTPLHYATSWGRLEIVELLIKEGANSDLADRKGQTAFRIALNKKFFDIAGILEDGQCKIYPSCRGNINED